MDTDNCSTIVILGVKHGHEVSYSSRYVHFKKPPSHDRFYNVFGPECTDAICQCSCSLRRTPRIGIDAKSRKSRFNSLIRFLQKGSMSFYWSRHQKDMRVLEKQWNDKTAWECFYIKSDICKAFFKKLSTILILLHDLPQNGKITSHSHTTLDKRPFFRRAETSFLAKTLKNQSETTPIMALRIAFQVSEFSKVALGNIHPSQQMCLMPRS